VRRRNKPRVVWLPPNLAGVVGQNPSPSNFKVFVVNIVGPVAVGDFSVGEQAIVIDGTSSVTTGASLSDVESSGYRLRRIVGKIWLEYTQINQDIPSRVGVVAGLIVRKTDPVTGASIAGQNPAPVGAELLAPSQLENIPDPWIWRRSWLFANNQQLAAGQAQGLATNDAFGSGGTFDGPHIDQKTARIIGPEERLFLDVSMVALDAAALDADLRVTHDLRVLASMRTTSGNRRNASR